MHRNCRMAATQPLASTYYQTLIIERKVNSANESKWQILTQSSIQCNIRSHGKLLQRLMCIEPVIELKLFSSPSTLSEHAQNQDPAGETRSCEKIFLGLAELWKLEGCTVTACVELLGGRALLLPGHFSTGTQDSTFRCGSPTANTECGCLILLRISHSRFETYNGGTLKSLNRTGNVASAVSTHTRPLGNRLQTTHSRHYTNPK